MEQISFMKDFNFTAQQKEVILNGLMDKLTLASQNHTLVNTNNIRNIGKTYALVCYSLKYQIPLIVSSKAVAKDIDNTYITSSLKVYSQDSNLQGVIKKCIVDEGVDVDELINLGIEVITGFCDYKTNVPVFKMGEQSFNSKIVDKLKKDAESLCNVMDRSLEKGEWTTYKNLAQNLEKIMSLISEYDDKPKIINCNDIIVNGDIKEVKKALSKIGINTGGKSTTQVFNELKDKIK